MPQTDRYVDAGRAFIESLLMPELTHLAVGTGVVSGTPPAAATGLVNEIGRARYVQRFFVVEDPTGTIILPGGVFRQVTGPTNFIYFRFHFEAAEAQATWTELGLFGGDVEYIARGAVLVDGAQAGDDQANTPAVGLSGAYAGSDSKTITCTVTTGGGSGVAVVGYSAPSGGSGSVTITFGTPAALGAHGLSLTFSGGDDGLLTVGDQWVIHCTRDPVSPVFASGGLYHPSSNPSGQVKTPGTLVRLTYPTPGFIKDNVTRDVQFVHAMLSLDQLVA